MHNGRLCLLKSDDTIRMSLQKYLIEKLDLPVFADYDLADPLNLTIVDDYNFIGVGNRCLLKEINEVPCLEIYAEDRELPIEFSGRNCAVVLFDEMAVGDVMQYRWSIIERRVVATYYAFNSDGVMASARFQLPRFLAECYGLDIGPYVIPSRTTATLKRLSDGGDSKKYRSFVARSVNANSAQRKRDPFSTKARSFTYRTVQFRQRDIEGIGPCLDMTVDGLSLG
jgi:hypothetical protein